MCCDAYVTTTPSFLVFRERLLDTRMRLNGDCRVTSFHGKKIVYRQCPVVYDDPIKSNERIVTFDGIFRNSKACAFLIDLFSTRSYIIRFV